MVSDSTKSTAYGKSFSRAGKAFAFQFKNCKICKNIPDRVDAAPSSVLLFYQSSYSVDAIDLVNDYVKAMCVQQRNELGEQTGEFATFSSSDGKVWIVPVYVIDTTDLFQAFSPDASIGEYAYTFVVCTVDAIPLGSGSASRRYISRVTVTLTINYARGTNRYARLTRVSGSLDFQEGNTQFAWGRVNYATWGPGVTNQNRQRNVTRAFDFNPGFTRSVIPTQNIAFGLVGATWHFQYRAGGSTPWINASVTARAFP